MSQSPKNIAVIGAGVAGLVAARRLDRQHRVTLFDANDYAGGHTRTLSVVHEGRHLNVDIGFIVFNDRTYPNFLALLDELGVASQPSSMGFSVRDERTGLEYMGGSLGGLFAQRRNLVRPGFYRMLCDIRRFFVDGKTALSAGDTAMSLGEFLARGRYGERCIEQFIVPMAAAIWSTDPARVRAFPAAFFLRFFAQHGLLDLRDRPQWRVLRGGSKTYVERVLAELRGERCLGQRVLAVERGHDGVRVVLPGASRQFDYAVLACHSDQALALLADPSADERRVLGAIEYADNEVVLHTDLRQLPRRRRAWAAWNYQLGGPRRRACATLTYNMNILQGFSSHTPLCVTLNGDSRIDPAKILHRTTMAHPLFTRRAVAAQGEMNLLNGRGRTVFCGAYWGNGFHEDGVVSALAAAEALESTINYEELPVHGDHRPPAPRPQAQSL